MEERRRIPHEIDYFPGKSVSKLALNDYIFVVVVEVPVHRIDLFYRTPIYKIMIWYSVRNMKLEDHRELTVGLVSWLVGEHSWEVEEDRT
jgi:hypothetical protein